MRKRGIVIGTLAGVLALWATLRPRPGPEEGPLAPAPLAAAASGDETALTSPVPAGQRAPQRVSVTAPEPPAGTPAPTPHDAVEPAACRLRGTLLDAETRLPLAGHRVDLIALFQRAAPLAATTDGEGVFELELDPGEYLALYRPAPGIGERALVRELAPQRTEVVRNPDGSPCEQTFLACRPAAVLDVEVRHADGRPAAGAVVTFSCRMEVQPLADMGASTDESGRALLAVWEPDAFTDGRLAASDDAGNVSDVVGVPAPFVPGLRRLVLARGAEFSARVLAPDLAPVAGRRVLLASDDLFGPRRYGETDAEGAVREAGLFDGAYSFGVWLPESSTWDRRALVLARGDAQFLEIVLTAPVEPLATAGVVLDEQGRPLPGAELAVALDGRRAGSVQTGDDGTFRFYRGPAARVWVGANAPQQGDRFEPAEAEVPFGTEGLVFRRVEQAERRLFEVEVYDRLTGRELDHFVATIDRGPGTEEWSDSYAPRRRFDLRLLPDARWFVKSHGYITREVQLALALAALAPGERLRIGLDPGLDHAFQVLDADTFAPIPDVLFQSATAGQVRSSATGHVHLVSDHWSTYRIAKAGYEPEDWDPDDHVLWGRGPFFLARP